MTLKQIQQDPDFLNAARIAGLDLAGVVKVSESAISYTARGAELSATLELEDHRTVTLTSVQTVTLRWADGSHA